MTARTSSRGSVLLIVMVTLVGAVFALLIFAEKAGNDLLVETKAADAIRLRREAYSALETVVSVLEEFRQAGNGLHSPAEGWANPLDFAGYTPRDGVKVAVSFEDESGKISLPNADANLFVTVFKAWGASQFDAERLSEALMNWRAGGDSGRGPAPEDYGHATIPYEAPQRSLRTFDELRAIDRARDFFYDEKGQPNDQWRRFVQVFSLYKFSQTNLNAAGAEVFAAYGIDDNASVQALRDYLTGAGGYARQGPQWLRSPADAAALLGGQTVPAGFGVEIQALRVRVTVKQGPSVFRLSALITPNNGGARAVGLSDLEKNKNETARTGVTASPARPTEKNLKYPFTLLEIRENDAPAESAGSTP